MKQSENFEELSASIVSIDHPQKSFIDVYIDQIDQNLRSEELAELNKPATQYAKSGNISIAYQVFGLGSIDLVYVPGWVSNIDWVWSCPELVHFLQELGKIARVILFDKRGTGLSDRLVELSTLEERMDDIRAVMDAAGSQKAVLFGHSDGGCASALFAATYPNRVISLITFGLFAKGRYSPDYPWAPRTEERQKVYDMIQKNWGNGGEMGWEVLAPSKAHDKTFMNWLANYFRSGASPSAAMMLTKMNVEVDIIHILRSIKVPTLVMQRANTTDVKIEEGRFIAERIPGAQFVGLNGNDHLFWAGNTGEVLSRMKAFILDEKPTVYYEKQLLTIIVARIVSCEGTNTKPHELVMKIVKRYGGRLIQSSAFSFVATFEGPSKAIYCSMDLMDVMQSMNTQLAIGIHTREVAIDEAYSVSGETKDFVKSILDKASPNQILITQTVKYLLPGTGIKFTPQSSTFLSISGDMLPLFAVTDPDRLDPNVLVSQQSPQKDPFFEMVLRCIDDHLKDSVYTVEMLCKNIGISERQLQRKLKVITKKSPNQLISSVRLHRAKELLLTYNYNIAEVAFQIGYSSPSYFSKKFKKEFGISPSSLLKEP